MPLRVVPSPTGLPSKRGPGLGSFSRADRGIGGVRHVAPPTWLVSNFPVARLEFPRETGLILRCAGKAGNPFWTTQGNRLSCRDQEGRRGSDEAVPGLSVFPSREPGVSGNFWVSYEGCQVPFRTSGRIMGLPLRRRSGQGPHLAKTLEPRVFSRFAVGFSSDDGDYRLPPLLALGSPVFHSSGEGKLGAALSHCRAKETSSRRVSRT